MTLKQKADAYEKKSRECEYWRALAVVAEKMAQGRAGSPGVFAIASQEYEFLKTKDPETFYDRNLDYRRAIAADIDKIQELLTSIKAQVNAGI